MAPPLAHAAGTEQHTGVPELAARRRPVRKVPFVDRQRFRETTIVAMRYRQVDEIFDVLFPIAFETIGEFKRLERLGGSIQLAERGAKVRPSIREMWFD